MQKHLSLRLALLLVALLPAAASAQALPWSGHWVNTDPADYGLAVLAFAPSGQVDLLMPAPQFSATYKLDANHVVTRMSDGSTDASLSLRGDSLAEPNNRVVWVRMSPAPQTGSAVGTWHAAASSPMESFMTLRSDGAVVLEVGFPMTAAAHGDTLRLTSDKLPAMTYTVRQSGDTMHVVDMAGKDRRFIRRPWGCLSVGAGTAPASECR
jgi:hypothetical protein